MENSQSTDGQVQSQTPPEGTGTPDKGKAGVQERTYTQSEYSLMQSTLRKEMQGFKDNTKSLQSKVGGLEAHVKILTDEADSPYTDDDSKTAAQKLREGRIALIKGQGELAADRTTFEADQEERDTKDNASVLEAQAKMLAEKTGVDLDALLKCKNPLEMIELVNQGGSAGGPARPDSGLSSAQPMDLSALTPTQSIQRGLEQKKRQQQGR